MHDGRDGRSILRALEAGTLAPADALGPLVRAAAEAPTSTARLDACRVLGALAGRAWGAPWEVAERAAFALLEVARETDAPAERAGLLDAMGRAFRNVWLMPYVHARMSDEDPHVVAAAIGAAGGLAFPALEESIATGFLGEESPRPLRLAALAALGRMGAESCARRLVPFVAGHAAEASAALTALTEIRSRAGEEAAIELAGRDPPRAVLALAVRYLAEVGREEVLPHLRRLARDEDPELRVAAGLWSRAYEAERARDASERILAALTERDRAVRAALARRLRTLPSKDVLEQAEVLLADDPEGVVQVISEVRTPEVTRLLVRVAEDPSLDVAIRARAAGAVEADEPWERDALVGLVRRSPDVAVRVAAAQTIGAFGAPAYVMEHLAELAEDPRPALRGALLWALQLAARPVGFSPEDRARAEKIVRRALGDPDATVRRRAAYVAGNLDAASLVPDLVALARESETADLRVAAFVGLGEIGSPARFADLVHLWNREDDPDVLGAASRAIERALTAKPVEGDAPSNAEATSPSSEVPSSGAPPSLARVADRVRKLLASDDAKVRTAAVRVAGLAGSATPAALAELVEDASPRVREQAVVALGRLARPECEPALVSALDDADPAVQEHAASALLALGTGGAAARVVDFVSRTPDRAAAMRLAPRLSVPRADGARFAQELDAALARVDHDDPVYEELLELKLRALEATRPAAASSGSVDTAIASLFPTWTRLSAARGFAPLAKSLRTAELLHASTAAGADTDCAAPIVLWMKSLEGYLHAWLAPKLSSLQERPSQLWELTDRAAGASWPAYQRWLGERWRDPVDIGGMSVEVPVRAAVNALRELQERRLKSLDSPLSVTEWSRLMLFFAVDHPSGPKNVLKVGAQGAERTVRLAHDLQVLAQVRNAVTHRSVAALATLTAFRAAYYASFEALTGLA